MRFERFIGTFFILNIILLIAVAYCSKNDLLLGIFEDIMHSEKRTAEYLQAPPASNQNFPEEIFSETRIKRSDLDSLKSLPPYDQAKGIVKMFSLMGDGECLTGKTIIEKINATEDKKGCSKDYAEIFDILASYINLPSRVVKNSSSHANEIYDGSGWIFIDPYYAMSASDKNSGKLSYLSFADKMLNNGWLRLNFFGSEDHCMSGKPLENHPYYGDKSQFAHIYTPLVDDTVSSIEAENYAADKFKALKYIMPYGKGKSDWAKVSIGANNNDIIRKYVTAALAVWILLFIATNLVLPAWFFLSMIGARRK
jgi:hypothetical protein